VSTAFTPDVTKPANLRDRGRYLPLAGVAFAALLVIAAVVFPAPPGGDVSPASDPAWLGEHTGPVIAQSYVRGLAALAFLGLSVAVAGPCRRVARPDSPLADAVLVGGALSAALMLLGQATVLAAALASRAGTGADAVRLLGDVQNGFLDMSALPAMFLFAGTGVATLRHGLLPRWLGWVSLAGVPFALIDAVSYDGGPLEAVGMLGLAYFLAWGLLVGVRLHMALSAYDAEAASGTL
jgi:hypothetical protein